MEEKDEQQSGMESAPGDSMGGAAREDRGDLEAVKEKLDWELAWLSTWRRKSPGINRETVSLADLGKWQRSVSEGEKKVDDGRRQRQ